MTTAVRTINPFMLHAISSQTKLPRSRVAAMYWDSRESSITLMDFVNDCQEAAQEAVVNETTHNKEEAMTETLTDQLTPEEVSRWESLTEGFTTRVNNFDGQKALAFVSVVGSVAMGVVEGVRRVNDPLVDVTAIFTGMVNPVRSVSSDLTKAVVILKNTFRS